MNISDESLRRQLVRTVERTDFPALGARYEGKVRDTYAQDDRLILITTDRISAFDHVLRQTIPFKGQVLNQLAAYFFDATADVIPNHVESIPDPNVTVATPCEPVPIEFVVRGYLAGHAWRAYRDGKRELCGQALPDGLSESSPLPAPILTPATKADKGHDEDIRPEEAIRRGLISEADFEELKAAALALFERGSAMARDRGLLLVDTKYEFGRAPSDGLRLIDEVHTPDSSRYYYADGYEERLHEARSQRQLSKEFVREWLMDHEFHGRSDEVLPDIPEDFRIKICLRYVELYEAVTGKTFEPDQHANPLNRIRNNVNNFIY